jgi:nitrogen fixation/metabolism regulation signal transduction histidine kinase
MTQSGYLFLGLTAIVAALSGVLAFAVMKFFAAARTAARTSTLEGTETAFMAAAMEQAVGELRNQQRAMKARAEASERLSSEIIASMTSGVLVVDAAGLVRALNPAGRTLLEVPDGASAGSYRDVLSRGTALAEIVTECLTTGRPLVRRSVSMQKTDGGTGHLGVTASPIRGEAGSPHGAICLFSDLSEVMELEEQLRIKDSLARLGELTAGIAHEFRNGLATIHGYGRLLDPERLPPDYRPYVAGIREETEALGQVVTNFLNFAKPAELVLTPLDVSALMARAADDIRGDVHARGGTVDIRGEFPEVDGDEVLLRQAFSNLCRNALEACVESGITPRIAIEGTVDRAQSLLRITVADNGPGVDEALAERMFRPFFTTRAKGTGLGLALVQKIVVTHNGRVTAGRAEGGGARLAVSLPLKASRIS